ncbi:MAG: hypothetical protein JXN62_03815 [Bacteroidales bacterium]|nr:hypothetical protein [Bacteroidales bacterium]
MRNKIKILESETAEQQSNVKLRLVHRFVPEIGKDTPAERLLTSEGRTNFLHYIEWLGLDKDPRMIVISSVHHFYYDSGDMRDVRTLINLKELNQIRNIESFIYSIYSIMPHGSFLIGCFRDNKILNGFSLRGNLKDKHALNSSENINNGIFSGIPFLNMIYSLLDARTNNNLSRKSVTGMLETRGFKVIDITDFPDQTLFCAKRIALD